MTSKAASADTVRGLMRDVIFEKSSSQPKYRIIVFSTMDVMPELTIPFLESTISPITVRNIRKSVGVT